MQKINNLELYDIYATWHLPFWQTRWFYAACIMLMLMVFVSIITWLIIKYRGSKTVKRIAWQIALEQLQVLQRNTYTTKAAGKHCYFAITNILKEYLHAQHQLHTIGKTDEELIHYLKKNTVLAQPILKNLEEICQGCLYIKFANQEAVQKQISEHLSISVHIVQETRPQPKKH